MPSLSPVFVAGGSTRARRLRGKRLTSTMRRHRRSLTTRSALRDQLPPTPPNTSCSKLASVVQTPEDANPGARVNVISVLTHDDPAQLQGIADAAGRGDLSIPIAARFKLSQLGEAHKALAGNPHGKILIVR